MTLRWSRGRRTIEVRDDVHSPTGVLSPRRTVLLCGEVLGVGGQQPHDLGHGGGMLRAVCSWAGASCARSSYAQTSKAGAPSKTSTPTTIRSLPKGHVSTTTTSSPPVVVPSAPLTPGAVQGLGQVVRDRRPRSSSLVRSTAPGTHVSCGGGGRDWRGRGATSQVSPTCP